ncbi:MAG: MarR family transcriptional regulator [Christensenellales bacterium]|jgi:DNA-binding MarR family transcriptional regulator
MSQKLDLQNLFDKIMLLPLPIIELQKHACSSCNITQTHLRALYVIRYSKGIMMSQLAKRLCISKPNLTPSINHLVGQGYIARITDMQDRRILHLHLTEAGAEFLQDINEQISLYFNDRLLGLKNKDRADLLNYAHKIVSILEKLS